MKEKLPIDLWKVLDKYFQGKGHLFDFDTSQPTNLVRITRTGDKKSGLHFTVLRTHFSPKLNKVFYDVVYLPNSREHMDASAVSTSKENIGYGLDKWMELLSEYDEKSTIFDDPITQSYYEELETTFTINDSDADTAPYPNETQRQLFSMYEEIKTLIENDKHPDNREEAEQLIKEIETAQRSIGKQTKRQASKTLQTIIAMVRKHSYRIGQAIIDGLLVEGVLRLVTGG